MDNIYLEKSDKETTKKILNLHNFKYGANTYELKVNNISMVLIISIEGIQYYSDIYIIPYMHNDNNELSKYIKMAIYQYITMSNSKHIYTTAYDNNIKNALLDCGFVKDDGSVYKDLYKLDLLENKERSFVCQYKKN